MAATASTPLPGMLHWEKSTFSEKLPEQPFLVRHDLANDPAFTLPRLIELARRLPEKKVEYYAGKVPVNQDARTYPKNGLSIEETVRRIEECQSWMVLKNVEMDEEYGRLLRLMLDHVYANLSGRQRKLLQGKAMRREHAFIFISSPNSVTPFHLDDEHNFLLQVRGTKQVSIWGVKDRRVMSEEMAESQMQFFHDADHARYMPYEERYQECANVFTLNPGDGLHFPLGAPHWVKNGPAVSISFSITFRSEWAEQQSMVYYVNRRLRRLGLKPTPPDESAWRDGLKVGAFRTARAGSQALQRLRRKA